MGSFQEDREKFLEKYRYNKMDDTTQEKFNQSLDKKMSKKDSNDSDNNDGEMKDPRERDIVKERSDDRCR